MQLHDSAILEAGTRTIWQCYVVPSWLNLQLLNAAKKIARWDWGIFEDLGKEVALRKKGNVNSKTAIVLQV